jgi:hypothetical protein
LEPMILAGIPVDSDDIEWLADQFSQLGFLETASKLLFASAQSAETVLLPRRNSRHSATCLTTGTSFHSCAWPPTGRSEAS